MKRFDFVVVGSGIAGLSFALKVARIGSVAIVTKRAPSESNTRYAQGGVACVTSEEDSFELHVRDTLTAGAGLCDERVVRRIVADGPPRIQELMELGVHFDERTDGDPAAHTLDLAREGGHSRRRILHSRDATGNEIEQSLLRAVAANPKIEMLDNHVAVDLITLRKLGHVSDDRCLGIYILDVETGNVLTIRSDRVILATGGCGKVYLYTTNPAIATGDGVAMAWRAGAAIGNMEFIQFHPTCLYHPDAGSFLISEAVRGEGGYLRDGRGNRFMERYDERLELAPRDIVARAIDAEMKRTGAKCVNLDITHKPAEFVRERFPTIYETCLRFGLDITREPIPVVPAAHYQCGGVVTDENGATSLRGLFAIGEVGCTGLHGANRLASNSLLEAVVVAHRCYELASQLPGVPAENWSVTLPEWTSGDAQDVDELVVIYHNWDEIRRL
ncbi:MAG TPA: L-aspartate oxidase, partial [Chthoniobacteraceae bacterium]|nr:L-aspartate oxidase [Chthoniobacteraceae bacterium]